MYLVPITDDNWSSHCNSQLMHEADSFKVDVQCIHAIIQNHSACLMSRFFCCITRERHHGTCCVVRLKIDTKKDAAAYADLSHSKSRTAPVSDCVWLSCVVVVPSCSVILCVARPFLLSQVMKIPEFNV